MWKCIRLKDPELRSLAGDIPGILLRDRAPRTMRKYQDSFQRWHTWAESKDLCSLPVTGQEVALYVAFLLRKARTMSTIFIRQYMRLLGHIRRRKRNPQQNTQWLSRGLKLIVELWG
jgi:hypothetical protein